MQKKKKKWITPCLIALVGGEPEERVLSLCKASGWEYGNPQPDYTSCSTAKSCSIACFSAAWS